VAKPFIFVSIQYLHVPEPCRRKTSRYCVLETIDNPLGIQNEYLTIDEHMFVLYLKHDDDNIDKSVVLIWVPHYCQHGLPIYILSPVFQPAIIYKLCIHDTHRQRLLLLWSNHKI
jgi:hypothetical protein